MTKVRKIRRSKMFLFFYYFRLIYLIFEKTIFYKISWKYPNFCIFAKEYFSFCFLLFLSQLIFRVFFEKLLLQSAVPIPPSLCYIRRPFVSQYVPFNLKGKPIRQDWLKVLQQLGENSL